MNIYSSKVRLNLASGGSIWAGLPGSSGHISKHLLRLPCVVLRSVNPPYHNFLQQFEKSGFGSWSFQCSGCEQHIAMDAWGERDLPRARPGKGGERPQIASCCGEPGAFVHDLASQKVSVPNPSSAVIHVYAYFSPPRWATVLSTCLKTIRNLLQAEV